MKILNLILTLLCIVTVLLLGCTDGSKCENTGIILDNACNVLIDVDGVSYEVINAADYSHEFEVGEEISFSYVEPTWAWSVCMRGELIELTCLE